MMETHSPHPVALHAAAASGTRVVGQTINDPLPESASLLLDVVRFTAAIMVVVGHYTGPDFNLGYGNSEFLGDIAVPVFFVLSGLVIRFVTLTRETTLRIYCIDRASRIYSVVLPAMAFTLIVTVLCFHLNPQAFHRDLAPTSNHPLLRLLANLTFLSQAWGRNTIPFVNIPFWSLGYECIYYVLYGFMFYLRGWRRLLPCALVAAIIGPQVLFLLPVWWLGSWLYDFYLKSRRTAFARLVLWTAAFWIVLSGAFALAGLRSIALAPILLIERFGHLRNPLLALGVQPMRATLFAVAIGVTCAVTLYVALLAVDGLRISRDSWLAGRVRYIANGTFTIYLMHYPFMLLLSYLGLLHRGHIVRNPLLMVAMCALLIAAAAPIDTLKNAIRRWLRGWSARAHTTSAQSRPG